MKNEYLKQLLKIELSYFSITLIKLIVIISIFFANNTILKTQWKECNNGLVGKTISCFLVDSNNTFTSTNEGGVFSTTNNGDYWIAKNNGLNRTLMGPSVSSLTINGNNMFAGTISDGIFLSTNKGDSWERKSNGLPYFVINGGFDTVFKYSINTILLDGINIFTGTYNGVYLSTNNGDNWIARNNGLPKFDSLKRDILSLASNGNNIYAGTRFGVYFSSDNGEIWIPKNNGMQNMAIFSLLIKGGNIYATACFNGIYISTNNGNEWNTIVRKDTCIDNFLIKDKYFFASGGFYISSDNGVNWIKHESGLPSIVVRPLIINGDYIFAGVNNYGIYRAKLSDLGITDVKETEQTSGIKIFPNPASNEFRLRFHTPTETTVQLSVFDLLGNCVLSQPLLSTEGTNEKTINCEKLPQGYYYVKININEIVETIPMAIVK